MSDWIDFIVYGIAIGAFWLFIARSPLGLVYLAERNPEWLAAHPEATTRYDASRLYRWSCYALGGTSLAALTAFRVGLLPWFESRFEPVFYGSWRMAWVVCVVSVGLGLVYWAAACTIATVVWRRKVPPSGRRHATLEPRSLDALVPRWFQRVTASAVIGYLPVHLAVGLRAGFAPAKLWAGVGMWLGLVALFYGLVRWSVARRQTFLDDRLGPAYRRFEVRFVFAAMFFWLLLGGMGLYEETTTGFDADRVAQLLTGAFVTVWIVRVLFFTPRSES